MQNLWRNSFLTAARQLDEAIAHDGDYCTLQTPLSSEKYFWPKIYVCAFPFLPLPSPSYKCKNEKITTFEHHPHSLNMSRHFAIIRKPVSDRNRCDRWAPFREIAATIFMAPETRMPRGQIIARWNSTSCFPQWIRLKYLRIENGIEVEVKCLEAMPAIPNNHSKVSVLASALVHVKFTDIPNWSNVKNLLSR